jgi:hypothetical protein
VNIFVTDEDPRVSAQALDDKRVIKMILESAQMLSTAMNVRGGKGPYKTTHVNHPCSVWARTSRDNYVWLLMHFSALCDEYSLRYGKLHKCGSYFPEFTLGAMLIPAGPLTPFANCTPHKNLETITAYRLTMKEKWAADKRKPTWKNNFAFSW